MSTEVDGILAFARSPRVEGDPFQSPAFRSLFAASKGAPVAVLDAFVGEMLPGLAAPDPLLAAFVALACGSLAEWGASPSTAGDAIVGRLAELVAGRTIDADAARHLVAASMAHLCRSAALRIAARAREGFLDALEDWEQQVRHTWYVSEVLALVDDELTVLALPQRRGYRVRIEAVRCNFHLITLLQGALIGDPAAGLIAGEAVAPDVLAEATGDARPTGNLRDRQRFHFHDCTAVDPDETLSEELDSMLRGECSPVDIPSFDGEAIVVMGPPLVRGRSWNSGFFVADLHDALRSRATVLAQMSAAEVDATIAKLAKRPRTS